MTQKCTLTIGVEQNTCSREAAFRVVAGDRTEFLCISCHGWLLWAWVMFKDLPRDTPIKTYSIGDEEK